MDIARWRNWKSFLPAATIIVALSIQRARGGNTTCVSNQLSWYSSVVGESPCMTYQRLRQICNNSYQVPSFSSTVPGDRCDDQVSECCCNMVAFQLSMLCMVCQQDHDDSGGIGIDAGIPGTYTVYRRTCGAGVNHTLSSDLQSAICNKNIWIDDFLYDGWDDGTWYYVYTQENAEKSHAANNNHTFTHCPDQISSSPTPTPTSSTTPTATLNSVLGGAEGQSNSKLRASLIGGIVGGILGLVAVVIAAVIWWRKKRGSSATPEMRHDHFGSGYDDIREANHVSVRARALAPNRLGEDSVLSGLTLPATRDNHPFMSGTSPQTTGPGTWSSTGSAGSPTETQPTIPLTEPYLRHRDGGPFGMGLARSHSGRLPPAYDCSWEDTRQRPTQPNSTRSVSAPTSNDSGLEISGGQTMPSAVPRSTSRPRVGEKARRSDRKHPSLFS